MVFQKSEMFLTMVIILFFFLTLLFLTLLTISRLTKIGKLKKRAYYDTLAGNFMFAIIFENRDPVDLRKQKEYASVLHDRFFKLCLLDTVIKLHKSYTGEYAKKIEAFYHESGLIRETYRKLNHFRWRPKCEAIRELAEMNVTSSYALITKYVNDKNLIVRQEAIICIIKLLGLKGLNFLVDYKELLTDWLQLNLIAVIKNNFPVISEPYYEEYLLSPNPSVVLFGKRLKAFYEKNGEPFTHSPNLDPISEEAKADFENPIFNSLSRGKFFLKEDLLIYFLFTFKRIASIILLLFVCFFLSHIFEISLNKSFSGLILYYACLNDIFTTLLIAFLITPIILILGIVHNELMKYVSWLLCFFIILIHISLTVYFFKTKLPLGSDFFAYSRDEIVSTIKAAGGFNFGLIAVLIVIIISFLLLLKLIQSSSMRFIQRGWGWLIAFISLFILSFFLKKERVVKINEFENYLVINKSQFFVNSIWNRYFRSPDFPFTDDRKYYLSDSDTTEKFIDKNFPFLKQNSSRNTLAPFFRSFTKENKPNFVFLILEGMGSDFTSSLAKLGSFTPFLDSLAQKSLFWENCLSAGGRTFAALPSIFASAPFLKQGFLEEGTNAPQATSFFKILKCNGYSCNYYTGSDASFDKMNIFLTSQGVDIGFDVSNFGKGYTKLPSLDGFSWGYGDQDIFNNYLKSAPQKQPTLSVLFTVANHSPYLIPDQSRYKERAYKQLQQLNISVEKKKFLQSYLNELSCLIYSDDALRYFFNEYSKQEAFKNTLFIITGDHRAPEIPISFQIDRFRVPLIIYSPLLKRTATFKSVVTHFDITPTLLSLLSNGIDRPAVKSWVGTVMDTSSSEIFNKKAALMRNKNEFEDFISNDHFLSGGILYKLSNNMNMDISEDESMRQQLQAQFDVFKQKNEAVMSTKKLVPDSVLRCR